jgi:hypothetical protein
MAEMLKDQVEKMGVDRNPVRQFFHLFVSGAKERGISKPFCET